MLKVVESHFNSPYVENKACFKSYNISKIKCVNKIVVTGDSYPPGAVTYQGSGVPMLLEVN